MGENGIILRLISKLRAFAPARGANIAMTFALSLVPVAVATGGAIDYIHGISVKSAMQDAADATALALCQTSTTLTASQLQKSATSMFTGIFNRPEATSVAVAASSSVPQGSKCYLTVSATANMQTAFLGIIGMSQFNVSATGTATLGSAKLQIALVLDNTGSMNSTDVAPTRIAALRSAALQFLQIMQSAAASPGDIQVAIVPFSNGVNVGTQNVNASWIDWEYYSNSGGAGYGGGGGGGGGSGWNNNASHNNYSSNPQGQNYWNPYTQSYNQYNNSCANWQGCWSQQNTTPSWTDPSVQTTSWNNSACTWSSCWAGNGAWSGPNNKSNWQGCVMDRDQNYDVQNTTPSTANTSTMFPAVFSPYCPLAMIPLSSNWTTLQNEINAMAATGTTDQTIGLVWGWQALTPGAPLNAPTPSAGTSQVIVLMTDGLNTENRWSTDEATIDARTQLVCGNIQAAKITIYAILVRMGDSPVLQQCAGDPSRYFVVNDAASLTSAFNTIATTLSQLRIAR